jgi:hypothetical protein
MTEDPYPPGPPFPYRRKGEEEKSSYLQPLFAYNKGGGREAKIPSTSFHYRRNGGGREE